MVNSCVVLGCTNRVNAENKSVRFYDIPRVITHQGERTMELSSERRQLWLARINRENFKPDPKKRHQKVCSVHFISGNRANLYDITNPDWAPSLHLEPSEPKSPLNSKKQHKCVQARKAYEKYNGAESVLSLQKTTGAEDSNEEDMDIDSSCTTCPCCTFQLQGPLKSVPKSAEQQVARCSTAGKVMSSVRKRTSEIPGGAHQIKAFQMAESYNTDRLKHLVKGECASIEFYEVECTKPTEVESPSVEEDMSEEEGVYIIEYSNAEEEGKSYQFTMSVDESLPAQHHTIKHPVTRNAPVTSRPNEVRMEKMRMESIVTSNSNKSLSQSAPCAGANGEVGASVMSSAQRYVCTLCPPPGRLFWRASGLAVHVKHIHTKVEKTFFCTKCKKSVRSQIEFDAHTRRHAKRDAVFTCTLCASETGSKTETGPPGFKGSKVGLKRHLEREHPGVIPRCHICNKSFKSLLRYLDDQFRHVGVSPYYCAECKIYELTERGLSVHMKNHWMKSAEVSEAAGTRPLSSPEDSATDDSDF
ncbi:zinc finger and SCAN domain-containing protein 21-like [Thalassophryne amazonica]|uniref:zinc finger and SCAN domain-containing protein 21-like n=1 Tax=Thalassophryne amazonica TaxID=390379 RepID=UPI001471CB7D|nr:zinc finger and SCAN domain-containing protein 21-like [Thalassophryne amazonica]